MLIFFASPSLPVVCPVCHVLMIFVSASSSFVEANVLLPSSSQYCNHGTDVIQPSECKPSEVFQEDSLPRRMFLLMQIQVAPKWLCRYLAFCFKMQKDMKWCTGDLALSSIAWPKAIHSLSFVRKDVLMEFWLMFGAAVVIGDS